MFAILSCWISAPAVYAQNQPAGRDIASKIGDPFSVTGKTVYRWQVGNAQVSLLKGDCQLVRASQHVSADAVLVVTDGPQGNVRSRVVIEALRIGDAKPRPAPVAVTWFTKDVPSINAPNYRRKPTQQPFLMQFLPRSSPVAQVQHTEEIPIPLGEMPASPGEFVPAPAVAPPPAVAPAPTIMSADPPAGLNAPSLELASPIGESIESFAAPQSGLPLHIDPGPPAVSIDGATTGGTQFFFGGGSKAVEIVARGSSMPPELSKTYSPETGKDIFVARGGVSIRIRDVSVQIESGELMQLGTVTLSADRVVGWTPPLKDQIASGAGISAGEGELYLEGDIVFRQGDRIIYADSMYYNVTRETGVILNAEAITSVEEYAGIVRLKADVLQQVSSGNFVAFDAAVTTSRLGVPRYWLQSERLQLNEVQRVGMDPLTGLPVQDRDAFVSSDNNFVFISGFPVLYWPRFSTTLQRPVFYLTDIKARRDDTFGTQVLLEWDMFQLLGIRNVPRNVEWVLSTDYLSERGPALGTRLTYNLPGLFGLPGPAVGELDVWGIHDDGLDRLGRDRLAVLPEENNRGRALLRHRHYLPRDFELIAELGWISDRNFLEQYLENEWDQNVDHRTAIRLRKYYFNQMFDLNAQGQVNDFFGVTDELPTFNHYLLGSSIFGDRMTWSMHNRVGYQRLNKADKPQAGPDFDLPGEIDRSGAIASTRQEISTTIPLGPLSVRPTGSFEAGYFGEASDGQDQTRLLGQAGVALNLPMVRVDPTIQSQLLNVRGLAHKMNWTAEYWYADSDANLDDIPLYDPLDDDAQEQFRRRFIGNVFGGALPPQFDPRTYAFRQGIQRWVTSPSDSIVDDLQQFRLGLNQRFQTKRGLPGRERIVDLFQLDVETILFPNAGDDNFGETIGPTTYDARYHIGDRFSLLSDGYFDWFDGGLRSVSAGLRTSRPGMGDWYIGLMSLEGPISSTVFRSTIDYRLNEKWIFSGGTTYDFGSTGNVGQSLGLTRIGESMLVQIRVNVDPGRDNVGWGFLVEPRFFARRLGRIGGGLIPPPGLEGLE